MTIEATATAIYAEHLSLAYHSHKVIEDCSFRIQLGQFIGIFGANGAGKTTLLRSLLGLIPIERGRLLVLDKIPGRGHLAIGYVPQNLPVLNVAISGFALLAASINATRLGLPWLSKAQRMEINRVIHTIGAENYAHRPFMELSGGEKRRLMIGQALLGKPRILLLDEPLANLDPHYQHLLIDLLNKLRQELGLTLLVTAHDVNPLLGVMNQVLYLAKGRAVLGSVEEVITSETLSSLYGSKIEVLRQNGRVFVMHASTGQAENVSCHH